MSEGTVDYWGRSLTAPIRFALTGLVLAPLCAVGALWLLAGAVLHGGHDLLLLGAAAVFVAIGQGATARYGRRLDIARSWIAVCVLAGVVATAALALGSAFVVLVVACSSDCVG